MSFEKLNDVVGQAKGLRLVRRDHLSQCGWYVDSYCAVGFHKSVIFLIDWFNFDSGRPASMNG